MFVLKTAALRTASTFVTHTSCARFSWGASLRSSASTTCPSHRTPPYGPIGVARAIAAATSSDIEPRRTLFTDEFALTDRVGIVTGANRGLGLDTAMAFMEAGARAVYCIDISEKPGEDWVRVRDYLGRIDGIGRLEYLHGDVRSQDAMRTLLETIGDTEGRLDMCVASAGTFAGQTPSFECSEADFQCGLDVNLKGALFTAQAAGKQMLRFGSGGSIVFVASQAAHVAFEPRLCNVSYHSSKAALLQLARSLACEHASSGIRVNTVSPAAVKTPLESTVLSVDAKLEAEVIQGIPLGRKGRPDEFRGVMTWLASDASSFCTGSDILMTGGATARAA